MNEAEILNDAPNGIFLTPKGYATLQQELEHLKTVKRPEIAERIRESQEHGEFSEDNSELDEVKFEQAMVENRIAELQTIFGSAVALEDDMIPVDHVGIGSLVTLEDIDGKDEFDVRLVMSIEADPDQDLISNESPLGLAVYGKRKGEGFEFIAPAGRRKYRVVEIRR